MELEVEMEVDVDVDVEVTGRLDDVVVAEEEWAVSLCTVILGALDEESAKGMAIVRTEEGNIDDEDNDDDDMVDG